MGFVEINNSGISLIKNICESNTQLFTVTLKQRLQKSDVISGTVFNITVTGDSDTVITDNLVYANQIISWINEFSKLFLIDGNIVAAQMFVLTRYNSGFNSLKGTMGISAISDYEIYKFLIKQDDYLSEDEVELIKFNITGDTDDIRTYIPNVKTTDNKTQSTTELSNLAISNRKQLFQNIINNPKFCIFTQCYLLSLYGSNNNNLAASSLLCYFLRSNETSKKYDELVNKLIKTYGNENMSYPLQYVDEIFKILGNKYPNISGGFGYEINNKETTFITDTIPITNSYLKILNGVRLTSTITKTIIGLDNYFRNANLKAFVTSGFRDKHQQLNVIRKYLRSSKLDQIAENAIALTADVDEKDGNGNYKWQMGWSSLLNKGYVVNPPVSAELLKDSLTTTGVLRKPIGTKISTTPHSSGRSFDISGADLDDIASVINKAFNDGKLNIRKKATVEYANNAVHVDCSETDQYDNSNSELD